MEFPYKSPTYNIDTEQWNYTTFQTRKEVVDYIDSQFKYPGKYDLKYTEDYWNEQGKIFEDTKSYPLFLPKSLDFRKHWDFEKEKCKFDGFIIYKSDRDNVEFALPGLMYWYLNYCPITDKLKARISLPEIYDGDYHYFLYILRCILHRKYGVVLKKRQAGYTLKNMSILLNVIWFGDAATSKIFASDKTKVEDSWKHMEHFRDHINKHCGWKRGFEPSKMLDWQIRRKKNDGTYAGNMSIAKGFTTNQNPTNGVGGNATVIFGEEAGINSNLDVTHEYITSNVALGGLTTGLIIYSGAVGELDKAEALKKFVTSPLKHSFLSCTNEIEEDVQFGDNVGFFAPEWWNYVSVDEENGSDVLRCYDVWGNTNKELAVKEVLKWRKLAEEKDPAQYRYYCSQRPFSIKEAFDFRKESYFPQDMLARNISKLEQEKGKLTVVELAEDDKGSIYKITDTKVEPILKYPLAAKDDKRGAIVIKEFPDVNAPWLTYFAGVDPIATDITTTSESLFSIYIFKNKTETKYIDEDGKEKIKTSGFEPVAWYTGRMEDMKKTNLLAEYLIRYYNALTIVESNVQSFIQHMQGRGFQKYLATKAEISFIGDLNTNRDVHKQYGVHMNPTVKDYILSNIKEYITEEQDFELKIDGSYKRTIYGVERIKDLPLNEELKQFRKDLNTDRIIAFGLALSMAKTFISNGIINRIDDRKDRKSEEMAKPSRSFFKSFDLQSEKKIPKSFFKVLK